MSVLVIAEHDNSQVASGTLNTVSAASKLGGDVHVLVAGSGCADVAGQCAKIAGVSKVLCADDGMYANVITENVAALVKAQVGEYAHVMAPASTFGKALIPYVAAQCDVQAISDISGVVSDDTFVRPIYAGNALETVQSSDAVKMMTVRTTAFELADAESGSGEVVNIDQAGATDWVQFVAQNLSQSERPELTSARIVVSWVLPVLQ